MFVAMAFFNIFIYVRMVFMSQNFKMDRTIISLVVLCDIKLVSETEERESMKAKWRGKYLEVREMK
jgi:hypothetical protein